ncbi:hypothetical protein GGS21DRAFT_129218 [Xylaria nigripes]|nr:hypothetical protein GGS21DRAFT_129218 [Xylaria nigripes]
MAQCQLPLNRMSFATLEEDRFFSAQSTQPTSRLMSVSSSQGREQISSSKDNNLGAQPLKPRVAVHDAPEESVPLLNHSKETSTNSTDNLDRISHISSTAIPCRFNKRNAQELPAELDAAFRNEGKSASVSKNAANEILYHPSPATPTRRGSSIIAVDQCLPACRYESPIPLVTRALPDGYISKQAIDNITYRVHAYLSDIQLSTRSVQPAVAVRDNVVASSAQTLSDDAQCETSAESPNRYLVTSDDITEIVDIVIASLHTCRDGSTQSECRSLLLPNGTQAKPVLSTENIVPSMSTVADPATTIFSPRPCFTSTNTLESVGRPHSMARTTYVSRRSITEINWGSFPDSQRDNAHANNTEPRGNSWYSPLHTCQNHRSSWPQPRDFGQVDFDAISPYYHKSLDHNEQLFRRPRQNTISEPFGRPPPSDQFNNLTPMIPVAPFPRFMSKSCANDWLTPLGLFHDVENQESAQYVHCENENLYSDGVDAHSGSYIHSSLPVLEEDPQAASSLPPHRSFQQRKSFDPPRQDNEGQELLRTSESSSRYGQQRGHSVGVASRTSASVRATQSENQAPRGNLLGRLHRYNFMSLSDQMPECICRDRHAQLSWIEIPQERDRRSRCSSQDLLRNILDRSDHSPMRFSHSKSDPWSPYSFKRDSKGRAPCSEDTTPHVCTDELGDSLSH